MIAQLTPAVFALLQLTVPCPDDVSTPCSSVPLVQTVVSAAETVPMRSPALARRLRSRRRRSLSHDHERDRAADYDGSRQRRDLPSYSTSSTAQVPARVGRAGGVGRVSAVEEIARLAARTGAADFSITETRGEGALQPLGALLQLGAKLDGGEPSSWPFTAATIRARSALISGSTAGRRRRPTRSRTVEDGSVRVAGSIP